MIWGAPWVVYSSQTLFFGSYNIVNSIKRWNETLQNFGLNQIDLLGGYKEQQSCGAPYGGYEIWIVRTHFKYIWIKCC
jgi:hypothetical protein